MYRLPGEFERSRKFRGLGLGDRDNHLINNKITCQAADRNKFPVTWSTISHEQPNEIR